MVDVAWIFLDDIELQGVVSGPLIINQIFVVHELLGEDEAVLLDVGSGVDACRQLERQEDAQKVVVLTAAFVPLGRSPVEDDQLPAVGSRRWSDIASAGEVRAIPELVGDIS